MGIASDDAMYVSDGSFTRKFYTFATLPAASANQGKVAFITDAATNPVVAPGLIAVGGGTTRARVLSDGTSWRLAMTME